MSEKHTCYFWFKSCRIGERCLLRFVSSCCEFASFVSSCIFNVSWRGHFPPLPVPTPIRPNACIPAYPQISTIYLNHHLGENCIANIKLAPHTDFPHLFRKLMGASTFPKGSMRTFAQGACMPRGHKISARVGGGRGGQQKGHFSGKLSESYYTRNLNCGRGPQQHPATGNWVTKTFFGTKAHRRQATL